MTTAILKEVHPDADQAASMPYSPGISVAGAGQFLFLSGSTASPLYHRHPHVAEEHILPDDIVEQTHRTMRNLKMVLDAEGMTWRNVVRLTKYVTDIREADDVHAVIGEYFGDWRPAQTLIGINNLSAPGARVELEMTAFKPAE